MTNSTTLHTFEIQITQHHIPINVLLDFFQLATLDRSRPDWRTTLDDQICTCIQLLGGVREPDLIKIMGVDQPTVNRRTRELSNAGTIRVARYIVGTAGKPAKWLQPSESADLDAEQRETYLSIAQLIIDYRAAWLTTQSAPTATDPQPVEEQAELVADNQAELPTPTNLPVVDVPNEAPTPAPPAPQPAPQHIATPAPIRPDPRSAMLTSELTALPPLWYHSFYIWMTPLIALGIFSYIMNERAVLMAFATQMGIPLLWLGGATCLIVLLVEYQERIFERFYLAEHRALVTACLLIITLAVVQSGLWNELYALWSRQTQPAPPQAIPTMTPTPLMLPEMAIPHPAATCPHGGPARVITQARLRLRQYASTDAPIIGAIKPDTLVMILCTDPIISEGIQWVQIQQGEQYGWVAEIAQGTSYLTRP